MFDRDRLQKIREEAMQESACSVNSLWKRALINLADAADRLDAMIVRIEDPTLAKEIKTKTCEDCSGKGYVRCYILQDESIVISCPVCKGTGKI